MRLSTLIADSFCWTVGLAFVPLAQMEKKRQLQFSQVIKRNFGLVLFDMGRNIYEEALVTVTNVKTSPDFGQSKIYLSVYNTEDKLSVIQLLDKNKHILKAELARRIRKHVRRIPHIDFYLDETLDEMYRLNALFADLKATNQLGEQE